MVAIVVISVMLIIGLVAVAWMLFLDSVHEYTERQAVMRLYKQLDTDYANFRQAAARSLDQANREVDRVQQLLLEQRQDGHDARIEIIRLAAEAERRKA